MYDRCLSKGGEGGSAAAVGEGLSLFHKPLMVRSWWRWARERLTIGCGRRQRRGGVQ